MKTIKLFFLKITLTVLCLSVNSFSYSQTAITVDINDIEVINGIEFPGDFTVYFAQSILPVLVDAEGPCGWDPPPSIFNGPTGLSNITCPGEYCYEVTKNFGSGLECTVDFCFVVRRCKIFANGTRFCSGGGGDDPIKDFYALGSSTIDANGSFVSSYQTYLKTNQNETFVTESSPSLMSNEVQYKIDNAAIEILIAGTTEKLIEHQTEIENENDFIFKFNSEGEMIWAYHNKSKNKFKIENIQTEEKQLSPVKNETIISKDFLNKQIAEELIVYPNPFTNELNIVFNSTEKGKANIELINLYGQTVFIEAMQLYKGQNLKQIIPPNSLSDGIYFIQIKDDLGNKYIKQVMYVNN